MYRQSFRPPPVFGGFGGRPPNDIVALLAVLFVTYSFQFFATTALIPALLRLSPAVWRGGFLWQLVTYGFAGYGPASVWILLELLVLFWFGRDMFLQLGRSRFWRLLLAAVGSAGVVAALVQLSGVSPVGAGAGEAFQIIQGQRVLLAILIASFAIRNADATILLFFVLPVRARWFLWIELAIGFIAFLGTKDLAGFAGLCTAIGVAVAMVSRVSVTSLWRGARLKRERANLERRLDRIRRERNLRLLDRDDDDRPTIH